MENYLEIICKLEQAANLTHQEVLWTVKSYKISAESLLKFYMQECRFPNEQEHEVITKVGVDSVLSLLSAIKTTTMTEAYNNKADSEYKLILITP